MMTRNTMSSTRGFFSSTAKTTKGSCCCYGSIKLRTFANALILSFFIATCFGFSQPAMAGRTSRINPNYRLPTTTATTTTTSSTSSLSNKAIHNNNNNNRKRSFGKLLSLKSSASSSSSSSSSDEKDSLSTNNGGSGRYGEQRMVLPLFVYRLNASTKWIISVCNTVALFSRPHCYEGPLVVFGSIGAVYFTNALKKIINQGRPDGAPFTDPGMPSSHSLTSFFIAAAWWWSTTLYGSVAIGNGAAAAAAGATTVVTTTATTSGLIWKGMALWGGASMVALLRVVCGYHTWAQIGVGAVLGTFLGKFWMWMGKGIYALYPTSTFYVSWGLYLSGAAFFISRTMKDWFTHEKHL